MSSLRICTVKEHFQSLNGERNYVEMLIMLDIYCYRRIDVHILLNYNRKHKDNTVSTTNAAWRDATRDNRTHKNKLQLKKCVHTRRGAV